MSLSKTVEDNYLLMLKNELEYDQTIPMERYVMRELTNPHSRAKKRERYRLKKENEQELLKTMIEKELADLKGRTRRVARLEAKVKWEMAMEEARKAELARRREARGEDERLRKKKARKAAKRRKEEKRLRDLVLVQAPNQVIPEAALQQQ